MTPITENSNRLWRFAVCMGKRANSLSNSRMANHVADQILICGTAAPHHYEEGFRAENREDGMRHWEQALKAQRETHSWLRFSLHAELFSSVELQGEIEECEALCALLEDTIAGTLGLGGPQPSAGALSGDLAANSKFGFQGLDHLAIVVPDTEEALKVWRDRAGLSVLFSEVINEGTVRLTHLDLGNTHLQLVEPLNAGHPLARWVEKHGPGLHHLCFKVEDVGRAHVEFPQHGLPVAPRIHQGTRGKRALFLDAAATQGVQVEVTGK